MRWRFLLQYGIFTLIKRVLKISHLQRKCKKTFKIFGQFGKKQ